MARRKKITEYKYVEVFRIDKAYVVGLTDGGFTEYHHSDGHVEKEDLRLAFELSGGHKMLLTGNQRFYFNDGFLVIEDLVEIK